MHEQRCVRPHYPASPVFQYVTGPPPPRSSINESDIDAAVVQLDEAAKFATTPDASGRRWVPGLSIVVVVRGNDNTCGVRYCEGHGTVSVDAPASVAPDTLFPCASLSKPVSVTLLVAAGVKEKLGWDTTVTRDGGSITLPTRQRRRRLAAVAEPSAGMPDHGGDLVEDMNPSMSRTELIERAPVTQRPCRPSCGRPVWGC